MTRILLLGFFCFSICALGEMSLDFQSWSAKDKKAEHKITYTFGTKRHRIDTSGADGVSILLEPAAGKIYLLNHSGKTVMEMDEVQLKKMAETAAKALTVIKKQLGGNLSSLPPAARKQLQEMEKLTAKPAKYTYKKLASNVAVSKWKTTQYLVLANKHPVSKVWTQDWKDAPLKRSQLQPIFDMTDRIVSMPGPGAMRLPRLSAELGLPIKTEEMDNKGRVTGGSVLTDVHDRKVAQNFFEVPAGYKKTAMPMMPK
ncbi:MAG: hypothetical protein H6617_08365 [Bdellovibrionaceae bacterium]|nr:hypothetical protein [Pseudobdellovibrionaceae bacterium]